jgi:hypothetical protein
MIALYQQQVAPQNVCHGRLYAGASLKERSQESQQEMSRAH